MNLPRSSVMVLMESDTKGADSIPAFEVGRKIKCNPQSINAFVISDLGNKLKCLLGFIRKGDKLIHMKCFGFAFQRQS